jgi:sporulation protein YlmC with PRC-barrel domain
MNFRTSLFVSMLCCLAAIAASAQVKTTPAAQDKIAATAPSKAVPIAGVAPLGITVEETAIITPGWRASKLLHATVYNDQNEKIGKVDDFIVSPDGSLTVAVVDVGGFLHLAAHRVAIPVKQFGEVSPKIVLKGATKEALLKLPEFKYVA